MKIGLIGADAVGSASLLSLVTRATACEIVVIDRNRKRAGGVVADLQYGATLSPAERNALAASRPSRMRSRN